MRSFIVAGREIGERHNRCREISHHVSGKLNNQTIMKEELRDGC
jgi:hypothetical protein